MNKKLIIEQTKTFVRDRLYGEGLVMTGFI